MSTINETTPSAINCEVYWATYASVCANVTDQENGSIDMTTKATEESSSDDNFQEFMIGLILAVISAVFTGSSFIFKKLGLIRCAKKASGAGAGKGGFGYLREWMWWAGMILMALGELVNFAAYTFAPASLVTPLGALSVIVSAILAARVLNERLNILGKVGCFLCILGSTIMVIHSPKEQEVNDIDEMMEKMKEPGFIVFAAAIVIIASVMIFYFAPRYGQKNVLVYITICATLGSFTVMGCKGVGVALKTTAKGENEFKNWITYVLLAITVACILLELNYLNRALDTFNTAVVTPIYYVFFTSCVIIGSAILFQEFFKMTFLNILGDACGFLVIVASIFLLNAFKDMKISWRNIPKAAKSSETGAAAKTGAENGDDDVFANGTSKHLNGSGVTNTNYILDSQDIDAQISRNMSAECITRTMSDESDCNETTNLGDRYHGSSPVQF